MSMTMTMPDQPGKSRGGADSEPVSTAGDPKGCAPCDIPPFCRNNYYRGKLLTEREFKDEQRYGLDKHRLHQVALHGWGVACGLHVKPHPYCPDLRLVIEEGLAIDSCGREIRITREVTIDLPLPPDPPAKSRRKGRAPPGLTPPAPPATMAMQTQGGDSQGYGSDSDDHDRGDHHPGEGSDDDDDCDPTPTHTYYLCLAYAECDTELAPAPFDDCGCNAGASLQPNRICEGFRLELYDEKPGFWDEAVGDECDAEDCRDLLLGRPARLPQAGRHLLRAARGDHGRDPRPQGHRRTDPHPWPSPPHRQHRNARPRRALHPRQAARRAAHPH